MPRKLTYEDIKKETEKFNGYKLVSKEYNRSIEKLEFICPNNHLFSMTWGNFQQGYRCNQCSGNKRITYERIKNKISSIEGYELLTSKNELGQLNSKTKFKVKCNKGHIYETCWQYTRNGSKCTYCSNVIVNIETIKTFIVENNINVKLISNKYIGSGKKLQFKCENEHDFYMSWDNFKQGKGCNSCGYKKIAKALETPEEIAIKDFEYNGYVFVEWLEPYHGTKTNCTLICPNNHVYVTKYTHFNSGVRCRKCYLEENVGENHPNWKGGISNICVYLRDKLYTWRKESVSFYEGKCDITGLPFEVIHHLYSFDTIVREAFEITNLKVYQTINEYTQNELSLLTSTVQNLHEKYGLGVCLTEKIHKDFHKLYGYGGNTPEQYEEFKNNKYSLA